MLQIIHLSDFHLNPKNLSDWNSYIKKAFIDKVKSINFDSSKLLIVCTGDLVDKGGKEYKTIQDAFQLFKTEVIDFICHDVLAPQKVGQDYS
ncbi:MAG: metallophosphoesterase [Bacteroidales bacterium]|nr:metallophosphoesterase [Bacteroidales bacterium]